MHPILVKSLPILLLIFTTTVVSEDENVDPGEPLYLTPLIQAGEINRAQEAALVTHFSPVISYSGLITINQEHNSNIFFWFFPAEASYGKDSTLTDDIPLILWSDGGPAVSCMFSIFDANGPFLGNPEDSTYVLNNNSWHKKFHMLYIDSPVQIGYSFTENEGEIRDWDEDVVKDVYKFLIQFFKLFPNYQQNAFYDSGVSYGGKYAIKIANYIHQRNQESPEVVINLKGAIVDSPWIDPSTQSSAYADQVYGFGLINEKEREMMKEEEKKLQSILEEKKFKEAMDLWTEITQVTYPRLTGYRRVLYDVYNDQLNIFRQNVTNLVTSNLIRRAIHVGNLNFVFFNTEQYERMNPAFVTSAKKDLDEILKNGYRFLIYVGNMDILTGYAGINNMMRTMEWEGANDLVNGTKSVYKTETGRIGGYITNLNDVVQYVTIRNAGHGCAFEKPELVTKFVEMFLSKKDINGTWRGSKGELKSSGVNEDLNFILRFLIILIWFICVSQ